MTSQASSQPAIRVLRKSGKSKTLQVEGDAPIYWLYSPGDDQYFYMSHEVLPDWLRYGFEFDGELSRGFVHRMRQAKIGSVVDLGQEQNASTWLAHVLHEASNVLLGPSDQWSDDEPPTSTSTSIYPKPPTTTFIIKRKPKPSHHSSLLTSPDRRIKRRKFRRVPLRHSTPRRDGLFSWLTGDWSQHTWPQRYNSSNQTSEKEDCLLTSTDEHSEKQFSDDSPYSYRHETSDDEDDLPTSQISRSSALKNTSIVANLVSSFSSPFDNHRGGALVQIIEISSIDKTDQILTCQISDSQLTMHCIITGPESCKLHPYDIVRVLRFHVSKCSTLSHIVPTHQWPSNQLHVITRFQYVKPGAVQFESSHRLNSTSLPKT